MRHSPVVGLYKTTGQILRHGRLEVSPYSDLAKGNLRAESAQQCITAGNVYGKTVIVIFIGALVHHSGVWCHGHKIADAELVIRLRVGAELVAIAVVFPVACVYFVAGGHIDPGVLQADVVHSVEGKIYTAGTKLEDVGALRTGILFRRIVLAGRQFHATAQPERMHQQFAANVPAIVEQLVKSLHAGISQPVAVGGDALVELFVKTDRHIAHHPEFGAKGPAAPNLRGTVGFFRGQVSNGAARPDVGTQGIVAVPDAGDLLAELRQDADVIASHAATANIAGKSGERRCRQQHEDGYFFHHDYFGLAAIGSVI